MYRQLDSSAGAEHQFHLTANSGSSPFTQNHFPSPIYGIDPNLQSSPQQRLHPGTRPNASRQSSHIRQSSLDTPGSMHPPRHSSPLIGSGTPGSSFRPTDRSLPSKDVTAETITDAYVDFILYCNPNFTLDVDTTTLRTTFQAPPKSDNKDFETFRLFELIKKFDAKEIKTWGALALDLGVEAPDTSKGQSVQKVQQYSVRLKRWMRAMHIDAFFEFLLGKSHAYFNEIPHPSEPHPSAGRDGVLAEEDLAIRALDPSFRPKRGRRRNSEAEQDDNTESESAGRRSKVLDSSASYSGAPISAVPMSAHPDGYHDPWAVASAVTPQSIAPWSGRAPGSAMPGSATSNLRWQLGHSQTPSTPHPMSAIPTSMSAHIDAAFDGEPKSAVTPSSRKRRRHGPAVSSAWPSNNAPGAKPRGRPPANRNVQDGPFNTFPADPSNDKSKSQASTSNTTMEDDNIAQASSQLPPQLIHSQSDGRPSRLSLQVPPHTGGPVRLATPPTLQINGETKESETRSDSDDPSRAVMTQLHAPQPISQRMSSSILPDSGMPGFAFETLKRVVASDLLRADIVGRRQRLTGDEAKRLADAVLDRLGVPRSDTNNSRDDIARLTAASWLGVGDQLNVPLGPAAGHGKRIKVTRFRIDADGYEEITYDEGAEDVREVFDLYWQVSQGGCMGSFEMKSLSLAAPSAAMEPVESMHDVILRKSVEAPRHINTQGWLEQSMHEVARSTALTSRGHDDNIDWRARCKAMEFGASIAKGEVERSRQRMLEKVMDALL